MKNEAFEQKKWFGGNKKTFSQNFLDIEEDTALEMIYLRNYAEAHFQTFRLQSMPPNIKVYSQMKIDVPRMLITLWRKSTGLR